MRRFPVEYRPEAATDIEDIFEYVLSKSQDLNTAIGYSDRIYARCESIGNAPHGGVARPDLGKGFRMVLFEKAVVTVYVVEDETVWIINVFAGGRDYETILRERQ